MSCDSLTGLLDRSAFRRLAVAGQTAVIFDVVGLIHQNAILGHVGGDAALRALAQDLLAVVDVHGGIAFRIGGDELLWLPPRGTEPWAGAESLRAHASSTGATRLGQPPRPLRLSVVVTRLRTPDLADPRVLCERVADLIYGERARTGRRGAVVAVDPDADG